jgi:hypothetical protein
LTDMISREAVLKAVYDALTYADSGELDRSQAEFVQKRILALPAVQPDAALAMRIAVEMEAHAALGTTTKAKADAILALIDKPGKEVMPDVEDTHHARPDTAPAGLSAGGGAGWQPIETAPKDGTVYLGCCLDPMRPFGPRRMRWGIASRADEGYLCNGGKPWFITEDGRHLVPRPTHWMPATEGGA